MPSGGYHENARRWGSRESLQLLELVEDHGKKWHEIGQLLGRTPASVRNRHDRIEKPQRHIRKGAASAKGHVCSLCGLPRRGHVCMKELSCVFPQSPLREEKDTHILVRSEGQGAKAVGTAGFADSTEFVDWLIEDMDSL